MANVTEFVPGTTSKCDACGGPKEGQFRDVVGVYIQELFGIVFCNSCALDLVKILLDRFYPVWGDGPVRDLLGEDPELEDLRSFFIDPNNGKSLAEGNTLLEKMQSLVSEYDDQLSKLDALFEEVA